MKSAFQDILGISHTRPGENFIFDFKGTDICFIQNAGDIQMLLKDTAGVIKKDMSWLSRAIGPSRVSENGARWESRRNVTQRHFSHFDRASTRDAILAVVAELSARPAPIHVDSTLTYHMIIDVLFRTFFGTTLAQSGVDPLLMNRMTRYAAFNSYLPAKNIFNASGAEREAFFASLIADRNAALAQLRGLRDSCYASSAMIRDLAAASDADNDIIFEQELLTIIAAGTESTAATLGWALHLLAGNTPFQQLCVDSAGAFFDSYLTDPRASDGDPIDFLTDETLRRYPGFPFLSRVADVDIAIHDRVVAAGTPFVLLLLGHDFQSRLDEQAELTTVYQAATALRGAIPPNFAFGGGRRICAGMAFAKIELRLLLAGILQHYTVLADNSAPEQNLIWQLSMIPEINFSAILQPKAAA